MKETDFLGAEDPLTQTKLQKDFDSEAWIKVVKSLILQQKYQKAEDCIRMALSMSPHCESLWLALGDLFSHLGKFDEAETAYIEGLKINPEDEIIKRNLLSLQSSRLN